MQRVRVGILGATGIVGQHLVDRLGDHPWMQIEALAASERSVGRRYGEAVSWRLERQVDDRVAQLPLVRCDSADLARCELLLSALDAAAARTIEPTLLEAGFRLVSNSSTLRMNPEVPLVVPEINAHHLERLATPDLGRGFVVTNPNCSVAGLALVLGPLHRRFGVRRVVVTTLQAVSGAGVSGPSALDLVDNVLPFIPGEEEKLESELGKILGGVDDRGFQPAEIVVSAHCHRVAVQDGHLEAVSVELERSAGPQEVVAALRAFDGGVAHLPSAPAIPVVVRDEPDRPQPRLDRGAGQGMSAVVGRVRRCPVLGIKLELLSHNAVRGAAGATLLNAELLLERGLVGTRR